MNDLLRKNKDALDPLIVDDLRPHLKELNWQLRRVGLSLQVAIDKEHGAVTEVLLVPLEMQWSVTCDRCMRRFDAGFDRYPRCPQCGKLEGSKKAQTPLELRRAVPRLWPNEEFSGYCYHQGEMIALMQLRTGENNDLLVMRAHFSSAIFKSCKEKDHGLCVTTQPYLFDIQAFVNGKEIGRFVNCVFDLPRFNAIEAPDMRIRYEKWEAL